MTTLNEILTAAQSLPESERAELIVALWDSTAPENWPPPSKEWLVEASRRSDAIDAGEMPVAELSEVRKRARRKAGLDE